MQIDIPHHELVARARDSMLDMLYTIAVRVRIVARYITRPTEMGVRVLAVRGDEVLLVRHRTGTDPWGLPGGGVKVRESLEEATRREVREEAGCPVRIERLHGVFHNFSRGFNNYIVVFICTPLADPRPPVGDLEIADARYVPLQSLGMNIDDGSRRRINEYLRGEAGLAGKW